MISHAKPTIPDHNWCHVFALHKQPQWLWHWPTFCALMKRTFFIRHFWSLFILFLRIWHRTLTLFFSRTLSRNLRFLHFYVVNLVSWWIAVWKHFICFLKTYPSPREICCVWVWKLRQTCATTILLQMRLNLPTGINYWLGNWTLGWYLHPWKNWCRKDEVFIDGMSDLWTLEE